MTSKLDIALKRVLLLAPLFFCGVYQSSGQNNFEVRHYEESQGLSSNFIEAITQSKTGHLIVAGKGGVDKFDGRSFRNIRPDSADLHNVTSICYGRNGAWFGFFNGNIGRESEHVGFEVIHTNINGQIKHIYEDHNGGIWAFSRSGMVFHANGSDTNRYNMAERDMLINAVIPYNNREFIIGSNDGLWLIRFEGGNEFQIQRRIEGLPETKITGLKYQENGNVLWVGTEDAGLHQVFSPFSKGQKIEQFLLNNGDGIDDVQTIFTDKQGKTWLGTFGNGLIRIEYYGSEKDEFITQRFDDELSSEYLIRDIYQDAENNIWVATFGGGLIQIIEKIFHQPFDQAWLQKQTITQLYRDSKGNIWLGIDKGLFKTSLYASEVKYEYFHVGGGKITSITEDKFGKIWVGTASNGLYVRPKPTTDFIRLNFGTGNLSRAINSIATSNKGIYVSTKAGLYSLGFKGKVKFHLSTMDGLPHNNVQYCYEDSMGRLWLANQGNRVSYYSNGKIQFIETNDAKIKDVNHILQDNKGRLWFATNGQGIFVLDNENAYSISENDGLPSNYCYQLVLDNDGNVWVGHQKSISQVSPSLKVDRIVGQEDISPTENSMISFIFKDQEGNIWISSTHNVVKFNPAIDKASKIVPKLSISHMRVFNAKQPMASELKLPYKKYDIKFELAGISLRNPDNIRYKHRLVGYTEYWSESDAKNIIHYPVLEDGTYTLQVVASKNEGDWTPVPAEYTFTIKKPFWATWYFYMFSCIILIALVFGLVRYRTYRLIKDKEVLESLIGERTVEIQHQKEEIESSRDEIAKYAKDITDSIKYARRIQKAIFPAIQDVQDILPESFVLFQSKDLVSGDFYYAEKVGDLRIFAAVDCTGHGVPGGFMSIVANNLLEQAVNQRGLTKPSDILAYLNKGVTNTLHQTYEESSVKDGMDIALCCLNTKTNELQFAGAYNPLYIFREGKLIEYKGDRFPVGTFVGEEIKSFKNHNIKVQPGDTLYLFSDGFSDQFGGPDGKKFKLRRFKSMLHELHTLSMDKQFESVKKRLNNWMGNLEQVDDIVLMGVRIT